MKALLFAREVVAKAPFLFISCVCVQLLAGLGVAASVFTIAPLFDYFLHPDLVGASSLTLRVVDVLRSIGLPTNLVCYLGVFLLSQVLKGALNIAAYNLIIRTKYVLIRDFVLGSFDDFFRAKWLFFVNVKQGTLLNTFTREIVHLGDAIAAILRMFSHFVQVCFYLSVPLYISWQVTGICIGVGLAVAVPFLLLGKVSYRLGRLNTSTGNDYSAAIHENLSMAKVILGFGNQAKSVDRLGRTFDAHRRITVKSQTLQVAIAFLYEPAGLLVIACAILAGQTIGVPLSELAVFLWAFRSAIPLVGNILSERNLLVGSLPSYEQIQRLRGQAMRLPEPPGGRLFEGFGEAIAVDDLTFAYPEHEPVLAGVNICIPKGKVVALVGESGGGKSTLADILLGLIEGTTGSVSIDGVPLREFDLSSYRQHIGYVPQESILFNMTIRENLLWSDENATQADIEHACMNANADEFIRTFPDGYDTMVGDRGLRLSGGQRQRIALARAVLRKPELLILDEATSSLDAHSERLIQIAIENISQETTVMLIAHRLSTVINTDHIYVLRRGRIVEEGTYRDLEENGTYFDRLVKPQIEGEWA